MSLKRPDAAYTGPELCALSAWDVVAMLCKGDVSTAELLTASKQRVSQTNDAVNSVVTQCYDRAVSHIVPKPDEHSGCLAGLPIGIKDLTAVGGVKLTMGTPALAENIAAENDPIVDILEARGGVVVGKTNTPEMGAGGNTFNAVFGATRNPWNTAKNAGGSSGGAAASLATGQVWLSHGSDLAGSLRTPAAYCGVVGMRPSPGRAFGGPMNLGFSNEGLSGPMARDVRDCALFLDAMSGYDDRAPLSLPAPEQPFQAAVENSSSDVKIAFAPDLDGFAPVEGEIRDVMAAALGALAQEGAQVEHACPRLDGLYDTYVTLRALVWASLPGRAPDAVQKGYKRTLQENIQVGRDLTVDQIINANLTRTALYHSMRSFLRDHDVLACAVVGLEPTDVEIEYPLAVDGVETADYIDWLRFSFLATTTGLPAISVPCGFTRSGMPVGIQLIGPPRGDAKVLAIARALERVLDLGVGPVDPR